MSGLTKKETEKFHPVIASMTDGMNADLFKLAAKNATIKGMCRNELIRRACEFMLKNKSKFDLK
jgi:hypothetical protein